MIAEALADAQDARASDAQVATLEQAVAAGGVAIEEVREAARRAIACMVDVGLDARYEEKTLSHGVVVPGYVVHHEAEAEVDAQIDACDERELHWVSKAYQLQPSSVEAVEQLVEQRAPIIRSCLEDNGVQTSPDDSGQDLATRASQAMQDSAGAVNCLADAGVDVW